MSTIFWLAVLNALLAATGQVLWKIGVNGKNLLSLPNIIEIMLSPYILTGLLIYGITTFLWLYLLSKADVSYIYPIQSLVFVIIILAGAFLFGENISINRWIGLTVICIGVFILASK